MKTKNKTVLEKNPIHDMPNTFGEKLGEALALEPEFMEEIDENAKKTFTAIDREKINDCTILVREDGILRIGTEKDISKDWQYRIVDATKQFTLVDIDHGKAQPIVKSILNELELFPELRMLKIVQITLYILVIMLIVDIGLNFRASTSSQSEENHKKVMELLEKKAQKNDINSIIKSSMPGVQK